MRALGRRDFLAFIGLDLGQDVRHVHARPDSLQLLDTEISCFSRAAAAPLSSDSRPIATPSLRVLTRPATMSAAAAFKSATSRYGLGMPSSTLISAIALAAASPPFSPSWPQRGRSASSGETSKVRIVPFSSAATKVEPV